MDIQLEKASSMANFTRLQRQDTGGHYESYFMRANDAAAGNAFWIRYTLYQGEVGKGTKAPMGELWAIFFEKGKPPVAAKSEFPLEKAQFSNSHFALNFDGALLDTTHLIGEAFNCGVNKIAWDLKMVSMPDAKNKTPLFPLPLNAYDAPLPRAKLLVAQPFVLFQGKLTVNGRTISVNSWLGSQNHNWGSRHTDEYAWGQVVGFDNDSDAFLEVASAKLKLGPFMTPYLTPIVLRFRGKDYPLNSYWQTFRNNATVEYFDWHFSGESSDFKLEGRIHAEKEKFIALSYYNPPGDVKTCLNTKIAACDVTLTEKGRLGIVAKLTTQNRAAFEILTSKDDHGMASQF